MKLLAGLLTVLLSMGGGGSAWATNYMGQSIGAPDSIVTGGLGAGKCNACTAGMIVQVSGVLYILSNAHCLAGEGENGPYPLGSPITMPGPGYMPMPKGQKNQYGGKYCNPTTEAQDTVAKLSAYDTYLDGGNNIDAAIAALTVPFSFGAGGGGIVTNQVAGISYPIASDITSPLVGMPVTMTAASQDSGTKQCKILETNAQIDVLAGNGNYYSFAGQEKLSCRTRPGDSGAVVWANEGGCPTAVGLHFAYYLGYGYANDIGTVMRNFGASPVGTCGGNSIFNQEAQATPPLHLQGPNEEYQPPVNPTPYDPTQRMSQEDKDAYHTVDQYAPDFMNRNGIVGMGMGHGKDGHPEIDFDVLPEKMDDAQHMIPKTLNGIPTHIEKGGYAHFD